MELSYSQSLQNENLCSERSAATVVVHIKKRLGDPVYWVTYIIPSSSWGSETSLRQCLCQSFVFAVTENLPVIHRLSLNRVIVQRFLSATRGIGQNEPSQTTFTRRPTLVAPKLTFLLDYQNVSSFPPNDIVLVSHMLQTAAVAGSYYLWITQSASFERSCLIAKNRKRVRVTVNSKYQRPSGCICPLPLWSGRRLWFIVV